ncbi:hypothetical protein F5B19DRAFT_119099 [Rostrohypoxylon terebratum]|nr:hypothetical protein F5B19DRAFT_119099 [Rostrohypoxylon terebratum]
MLLLTFVSLSRFSPCGSTSPTRHRGFSRITCRISYYAGCDSLSDIVDYNIDYNIHPGLHKTLHRTSPIKDNSGSISPTLDLLLCMSCMSWSLSLISVRKNSPSMDVFQSFPIHPISTSRYLLLTYTHTRSNAPIRELPCLSLYATMALPLSR